jgi:rhodanese-related sulfurtransferase
LLAAVALLPRLIRRLKGPRFIDPDELKRRLDSREQLGLIDVRTPDEFLGPLGHIVSAENIPVVQLPGEIGKIKESRENLLVTICPCPNAGAARGHRNSGAAAAPTVEIRLRLPTKVLTIG